MATKARSKKRHTGRWEDHQPRWYEQTMTYCELCGVLIPSRQWVVRLGGRVRVFCGADCARLYQNFRRLGNVPTTKRRLQGAKSRS